MCCRTVRPSVSIPTLTEEMTAVSRVGTWFPAMDLVEANAKGRRKRDQIPGKGVHPSMRVSHEWSASSVSWGLALMHSVSNRKCQRSTRPFSGYALTHAFIESIHVPRTSSRPMRRPRSQLNLARSKSWPITTSERHTI